MSKGKIITAVCCVAILALIMFINTPTAKTLNQFIIYYNREIENTTSGRNVFVSDCLLNEYGGNRQELFNGNVAFMGQDNKEYLSLGFAFDESVSSDVIFSIIDAAILASGEDCDNVAKSLGILSGNKYSIRGGDEKKTTFNGKNYSVHWVDEGIFFVIEMKK